MKIVIYTNCGSWRILRHRRMRLRRRTFEGISPQINILSSAEEVRFELTIPFRVYRIFRPRRTIPLDGECGDQNLERRR